MVEEKKRKKIRTRVQIFLYLMACAWRRRASLIVLLIVLFGLFVFSKTVGLRPTKKRGVQNTSLAILQTTARISYAKEKKKTLQTFSIQKGKATELGTVIGIDLGSTYSRVGVFKNFHVEMITNDQGNSTIPSWVAFTDGEILIGEAAKNQAPVNAERTIFHFKRFIGRKFDDKEVQKDMKLVPYKFVNKDGKPYIQVNVSDGETNVFSPEEISTMVLTKMKETAEAYLGNKIRDAVLTVPAYFDNTQSQAIKDAGIVAGLNVVRVIHEPIAAAISHELNAYYHAKNVLVFDLGGATFDVTILTILRNKFEVVAINGDTHLGGDDFDQRVVDYFIKLIQKKHGNDIRKDERALGKLRRECECAKIALSSKHETRVVIESLFDDVDFSEPFTRAHFEELNDDLFKKTLELVKKAIEDAGFEKHQINNIVLVGGSTKIPKVQQVLKDFFNGKELIKSLNPDEEVSSGASVLGGILNGEFDDDLEILRPLYDVTPIAVGIETVGGVMTELIPKYTVIPAKKSQIFTSYQDRQTTFTIQVYYVEGNQNLTKDCSRVAKFDLNGVVPALRGTARIEVTAEIDANRLLHVKAEDLASGKSKKITVYDKNGGTNITQVTW